MKLTPEQLKLNAAAMIAFADGKPVQSKMREAGWDWENNNDPVWLFDSHDYRSKPDPISRPWSKPEDVPGPVCWLRLVTQTTTNHILITRITDDGLIAMDRVFHWSGLHSYQHSTDRKTWKACVVEE